MNSLGLSEEIWNVVKEHYVKECYTDCITDIILYLYSIIRDKTGIEQEDGEKLISSAFSEKNPKLLINNNITASDKDEQRGFLYLFKWLTASLRNPISHDKTYKFTKEETESILLLVNNYIMKRMDDSIECSYVDNWFDFIFIDNKLDSEDYSNSLVDNIPKRKMFDLMIDIINNLEDIELDKYSYFINQVYSKLTIKNKENICELLNSKLLNNNSLGYFASFLAHFDPKIYKELNALTRSKISNYVENALREFEDKKIYKNFVISAIDWIDEFNNKDKINDRIMYFLTSYKESALFVCYRLKKWYLENDIINVYHDLVIEQLNKGNPYLLEVIKRINDNKAIEDKEIIKMIENFKESLEWIDLPF